MRLFELLLQFEIEAFEAPVLGLGALERGDRELERSGGADVLDILVSPRPRLGALLRFVNNLVRANL